MIHEHRLNDRAARNLMEYLREQIEKVGTVPDDQTIVVERYADDLGDWRICILSPFGAKVHAPWTHAIEALIRKNQDLHVETMWSNDGIVVRFPGTDDPPAAEVLFPDPDEVEELVIRQLSASALFASSFREAAARALLLPRRYPGQRTPLWQQRKRAFDLLQTAARHKNFPIILEAHREVLRDIFDMPGLIRLLREIRSRSVRTVTVDTRSPSPFASSLMFGYVGNFMYEGDAPLAERRAQALLVDQAQLRELLGESELRELLDPDAIAGYELQIQSLDPSHQVKHPDGVHDLLLRLGELSEQEICARCSQPANTVKAWIKELKRDGRIVLVRIRGESCWIAVEDAGRYRDALGIPIASGLPALFLERVKDPISDIVARYARTHGPFQTEEVALRFGLQSRRIEDALLRLERIGRVAQGEFRRGKTGHEWCDSGVLGTIRQKSLSRLRREVEPVDPSTYARFLPEWHRIGTNLKGTNALLEVIGQLQGYPLPASVLETQILPARLNEYDPRDLDTLLASGLVLWTGVEALGQNDGRIALYRSENAGRFLLDSGSIQHEGELHAKIRGFLNLSGASFFPQIFSAVGGFKRDVLEALWGLVWAGEVTNDTLMPLRALLRSKEERRKKRHSLQASSRLNFPPEASGRWSLVRKMIGSAATPTERLTAAAWQLLERLGIITREALMAERIPGGFSALYPVLKAFEEAGKIRRGYFIAGRGAAQFASLGALERLRSFREPGETTSVRLIAATDPANPYGAALPWPLRDDNYLAGRIAGAQVILVNGHLAAFWAKKERLLLTYFNPDDPDKNKLASAVAKTLSEMVIAERRRAVFITQVDGKSPADSCLATALKLEGFVPYSQGWQKRKG